MTTGSLTVNALDVKSEMMVESAKAASHATRAAAAAKPQPKVAMHDLHAPQ